VEKMQTTESALKTRWFWYSIVTVIGWAGWALFLKLGSEEIPSDASLFLQTAGMVPLALVLLFNRAARGTKDKKGIVYSLLNGAITGLGILSLLAAYRSGGNTAVVSVTSSLYPLVTFALALVVLHEKLTKKQILGVVLATVSIVLFSL
jgi:uncharacterized membrane protein